jgi:hypothetical protein
MGSLGDGLAKKYSLIYLAVMGEGVQQDFFRRSYPSSIQIGLHTKNLALPLAGE